MSDSSLIPDSTALQVNLERTAANVEIPEKYHLLLRITESHYGLSKRMRGLLTELNHPFVNWDHVARELKTLSIGDFYDFSSHPEGLEALRLLAEIYFIILTSCSSEEVRETTLRSLFTYLDTITDKSREFLERNLPVHGLVFENLVRASLERPGLLRRVSPHLKDAVRSMMQAGVPVRTRSLETLLHRVFGETYRYWLSQEDPGLWLEGEIDSAPGQGRFHELVRIVSHDNLTTLLNGLENLHERLAGDASPDIGGYLDMPDHSQIAGAYLTIAETIERSEVFAGHRQLLKLSFLFHMMSVEALSDMQGTILREINRSLGRVLREEKGADLNEFVRTLFGRLERSALRTEQRGTVLDCITTLAREVFAQNNHPLADTFLDELIAFGFQHPEIKGTTTEWQVVVNPLHIRNIKAWFEIISLKPRWTKRLLSALIINLKLGGVFVRDTDLLQKDVSTLLNSDITPAYNLVKQLLRTLPIYFSQIGAEGDLRDISTRMDELSQRNDRLLYFLRKQSHVESNSLLVPFVEDIFRYWHSGDKEYLRRHLPPEVFEETKGEGEYFRGLHEIFLALLSKVNGNPKGLLEWDTSRIEKEVNRAGPETERDRERAILVVRFYQLLYKKYHAEHIDILHDLEEAHTFDSAQIRSLGRRLKRKDYPGAINIILGFLATLRSVVLSPERTTFHENIYRKRHIAAGIPSLYGSYSEKKFEAVGLSLRLESLATVLFERLVESLNLKFITKSTLIKIHRCLGLYVRALDLEGISTEGLVAKMRYLTSALQVKEFSVDQYIDIFQFISKGIQEIIRDYYIDVHSLNLPIIVPQILTRERQVTEGTPGIRDEEAVYQHSESFVRSVISSAFGLQVLDNFINGIIRTLNAEMERFKSNKQILNLVMAYNPELTISTIHKPLGKVDNQILIGNKGYFLKQLASFGFPVPPGFILTTEVFRGYEAVLGYKYIFNDLSSRIYDEILKLERVTGKRFGDPRNPLLVSVRSGATISLPGMMHSFLNVGINEEIARGLAKRKEYRWAAWDSYRRFLQTWGMFHGLDRDFFDGIMDEFKQKYQIARKIEFGPDQMKLVATSYREAMEKRGIEIPGDVSAQLQQATLLVFASWYSEQATIFRHQVHLSDDWGTAVIVQAMVFGNLNANSGSGVIFTRNPKGSSSNVSLHGDFIFGVQGDDIVSGLVETYPISERQRVAEKRGSLISLESRFPEIYSELVRLSENLIYEKRFNHQEIEFTFENPFRKGLSILQTRDMVARETRKLRHLKETKELIESLLGTGIGVSGGALCGRAVYSEEQIARFRKEEPDTALILIRPDTVPDDVRYLLKVDGLLTARGGGTSHAAVTIPQLNKVGVVGFNKLRVHESEGYSDVDGKVIRSGDFICIDGWSGAVYLGRHESDIEESYTIPL
jgi:pyruvate,orthophosphate dikinase